MALNQKESTNNYLTRGGGFLLAHHISVSYRCKSYRCEPLTRWRWRPLMRWRQRFCCSLVHNLHSSRVGDNEVLWATTPQTIVSSHLTFKSGMVSSSTFPTGHCWTCGMTLRRTMSKPLLVLVHSLTWGSLLDPLPLLIGRVWIQGP